MAAIWGKLRAGRLIAAISGLLIVVVAMSLPLAAPALAAAACPRCYGFEVVADGVYAEREMPARQRQLLSTAIAEADLRVSSFFGALVRKPIVLACSSETCDQSLRGRGARARTYSSIGFSVVVLSPRGISTTIVAHELSHVQVHAIVGVWAQMRGTVPAWFDEGLATVVSDDTRYVKPGATAADRCMTPADGDLPRSPFDWGPQAGRTPWIYAQAACRVLAWMEANGGRDGVIAALHAVASGKRELP